MKSKTKKTKIKPELPVENQHECPVFLRGVDKTLYANWLKVVKQRGFKINYANVMIFQKAMMKEINDVSSSNS